MRGFEDAVLALAGRATARTGGPSEVRLIHLYIREAHPTDEWQMNYNSASDEHPEGVCYAQPRTMDARLAVARDMQAACGLVAPIVCDGMANAMDEFLAACPERIYVLQEGRIVFKTGQGPFLYDTTRALAFLEGALGLDDQGKAE